MFTAPKLSLCVVDCVTFVGCADYPVVEGEPGTPVAAVIRRVGPPTIDKALAAGEGQNFCAGDPEAVRQVEYHLPPPGTLDRRLLGLLGIDVVCVDASGRVTSIQFIEFD